MLFEMWIIFFVLLAGSAMIVEIIEPELLQALMAADIILVALMWVTTILISWNRVSGGLQDD